MVAGQVEVVEVTGTQQFTQGLGGIVDIPQFRIVVEEIDPAPVEPGEDVTVGVRLQNIGGANAQHVNVLLDIKPPFKYKTQIDRFDDITLCAGCSKDNTYYLTVDDEAVSGVYPLNFYVFMGDTHSQLFTQKVEINVRGVPNLVYMTESVDMVVPNTQFPSMLHIDNIGTGRARQIKVRPTSEDFIVLGSSLKTIDLLQPTQEIKVPLIFTTSENIPADVYHIPVEIEYLDEKGSSFTNEESIGVRVIDYGEINIDSIRISSVDGSPMVEQGKPFTITARLENVGYGNAEYISSELDCPFEGNKKAYVGQLDRYEDAPAVFRLLSKEKGHFNCILKTTFKDDTGYHVQEDPFDVFVRGNHKILWILLGILGVVGVVIAYRKFIKEEKLKDEA